MHQHRFRVVVSGVGRGDFPFQPQQEAVPGIPGGGLQPFFAGNHLTGSHMQRDFKTLTQAADKGLVPVRFFPSELMIKMGGLQMEAPLFFQKIQGKQQRHGVRPAGNGTDDGVPRGDQSLLPDEVPKLIQHASTPGRQRSGTGRSIAASPRRSRRGGSWQQCTRPRPCPRCFRCSIRPGTGT